MYQGFWGYLFNQYNIGLKRLLKQSKEGGKHGIHRACREVYKEEKYEFITISKRSDKTNFISDKRRKGN